MPRSAVSEAFGRIADSLDQLAVLTPRQQEARLLMQGPQRNTCLVGGTRSGKTFAVVQQIIERAVQAPGSRHLCARFHSNAAWQTIGQETIPAVVRRCFPGLVLSEARRDGYFELPNGSRIHIGGLDDKDRADKILGTEYASVFLNEASQIPYGSALIAFTRLAQVVPGLKQRGYVDLNPTAKSHWTNQLFGEKRDPVTRHPLADPGDYARLSMNPADNASNLSPEFLRTLETLPERQRKRFFEGAYVEDSENALWSWDTVAQCRCDPGRIPPGERAAVVVAVDPSGAASRNDLKADEIGIVVAARGRNGHGYVLADLSARLSPREWAARAVRAFHEYAADCIVAESNFGGAMVEATILSADRNVPVRMVTASRGKAVRAEPISVRYGRGEVHHAGEFPVLEDQLVSLTTDGFQGSGSPDHADAAIWALTHLLGAGENTGMIDYYERMAREQQAYVPPHPFASGISADTRYPVRMVAPVGYAGTLILISGRSPPIPSDGVLALTEDEAKPLRALGWQTALETTE